MKRMSKVVQNSEKALELIEKIYNDFDLLNGYLYGIHEEAKDDTPEFNRFSDIWMNFPAYHTLDELKEILTQYKKERAVNEQHS